MMEETMDHNIVDYTIDNHNPLPNRFWQAWLLPTTVVTIGI